jgi:uncharacterized phosphosugar-binding protein
MRTRTEGVHSMTLSAESLRVRDVVLLLSLRGRTPFRLA